MAHKLGWGKWLLAFAGATVSMAGQSIPVSLSCGSQAVCEQRVGNYLYQRIQKADNTPAQTFVMPLAPVTLGEALRKFSPKVDGVEPDLALIQSNDGRAIGVYDADRKLRFYASAVSGDAVLESIVGAGLPDPKQPGLTTGVGARYASLLGCWQGDANSRPESFRTADQAKWLMSTKSSELRDAIGKATAQWKAFQSGYSNASTADPGRKQKAAVVQQSVQNAVTMYSCLESTAKANAKVLGKQVDLSAYGESIDLLKQVASSLK